MIRVLTVLGTRPEAIKLAPVVRALRARPQTFDCRLCLSAQHRQMLDQVLSTFDLTADFDLDLMTPGQTPAQVVARVMERLPPLLADLQPDVVVVQGDTMTTFAASFAAYLSRIASAHVEAGLRTGDRWQPFPEEMNRVLTSRIATLHFPPTPMSRDHLLKEGIPAEDIVVTGNTVIDALLQTVRDDYRFRHPRLQDLDPRRRLVLVTTHRRESFGAPLRDTCAAIRDLAERFDDLDFVLPVHPNPQVKAPVEEMLGNVRAVRLVEPLDYLELVHVMARSVIVLTDSGGIQEEAPSLGKPVLVLREVTERPEGVTAGTAIIVGTDRARIVSEATSLLTDRDRYEKMARAVNPYGDGKASERIADALESRFAKSRR